jgi:hypothetical protein
MKWNEKNNTNRKKKWKLWYMNQHAVAWWRSEKCRRIHDAKTSKTKMTPKKILTELINITNIQRTFTCTHEPNKEFIKRHKWTQ